MTTETARPVDPRRVFALVVGIESYDISTRWDLPGAARDAERVADWLTGPAQVPADQVHLLLSPLDRTVAAAPAPTRHHLVPTRENVERILFKELPACDGDLLWIYWAGHGYLDPRRQLLLPYTDATTTRTVHLNLEAALRWWKSEVPADRFPRQIVLGDACRVEADRAKSLTFGDSEYGGLRLNPRRRQFTLYAARAGELAQNLADRGAGQFTDTLMRRLAERTLDESVNGAVALARAVQADLRELRATGHAWQNPQFLVDRDWDDSTIFGDHWAAPGAAPATAAHLDQTAWNALGPLLRGGGTPAHTHDAYRWAFEITGCVFPAHRGLPTGGLTGIAHDLDARQGRRGDLPLTLPFVRHLAARSPDPAWAERAEAWVDATRERLGAAPVPAAPEADPEPAALHVRLTEDPAGGGYWTRMWLHRDGAFEAVRDAELPLTLDAVREHLAGQLLTGGAAAPARIEFHVPYGLLTTEFERWRLPIGRRGKAVELGWSYEVVVRCPDERDGLAGSHWHRKWQWFKSHGGAHPEAVQHVTDGDVSGELGACLQATEPPVCVLAEVSDEHLMDALDAVLDAGIPIALWPRPGREGRPRGELATALRTCGGTGTPDVGRLPGVLKALRIPRPGAAAAGTRPPSPPALLWDDPERVPERRPLS
ncbi:caspase family protein [Streptomyces alboniger]|uniref:VMAP-C domain-containing protein n=2 Tax=Streptomyces alboniger TaxID=132473 RepID=UPI00142F1970|nr:caspase family protein [Streptomyces alboniger]